MNRVTPLLLLSTALLFSSASTACLDPDEEGNLVAPTVDGDPKLPRVELNGSVFHAETFGDPNAPVIIMLHGGPGQSYGEMLRLRQPVDGVRLEDHHFLVFWDQRGSGLSRRHSAAEVTNEAYEADLAAIIDKYSPNRPVVLMGHSWGGMYATMYIAKHPERIAGAVLMDSGPFTGASFEEIKGDLQHIDMFSEWLNDLAWAQTVVSPDGHARADYWRMLGQLADSQPKAHLDHPGPITWRVGAVASAALFKNASTNGKADWDFTKGLERFDRPVLFEGGELSGVTGVEFQKKQMKAYPQAHLEGIAGAGHHHQWTHVDATLRPIFTYLTSINF